MKAKIMAALARARTELPAPHDAPHGGASWVEALYNGLRPYLKDHFPGDDVAAIVGRLGAEKEAADEAVQALRLLWTDERRTSGERRVRPGVRIELESGKVIWYNEKQETTGFDTRSSADRRVDTLA